MSVEITPSDQLVFSKPAKDGTKTILKVKNKGNHMLAFKIKTTAPRLYCVRPNAGCIFPFDTIDIQVVVQPIKENFTAEQLTKCKDKFLVQSVELLPNEVELPTLELWPHIESVRKDAIHEQKIRCVYIDPVLALTPSLSPGPQMNEPQKTMEPSSTDTNMTVPTTMDALNSSTNTQPFKDSYQSPPLFQTGTTLVVPNDSQKNTGARSQTSPTTSKVQYPLNTTGSFIRNESVPNDITMWEAEKQRYLNEIERLKNLLNAQSKSQSEPHQLVHTIVNPNSFSPQFVFVVAFISFIIGALLY
ncbi:phosphatidylinositol-binding protein scs2 [Coelomomyces lativittatus]|nr:phosphatidylinositol-binding protein scs2 [Coelomomyces lativittatus]KAJ1514868.1 phosphatidylinositol-binding protein scs2 [Coelomomyces lativittatus]